MEEIIQEELYVTIAGIAHYYDQKPFHIGTPLSLFKEPGNRHDTEAIVALMPLINRVGYVANSPYTVVSGCLSAGRIYDHLPDECLAIVRFMHKDMIIARVFPDKKLDINIDVSIVSEELQDLFRSAGHQDIESGEL